MIKVAFDCSGTLLSSNENKVVALYKWFQSKGCDMYIWSSSYSYTEEAKRKHQLVGTCISKYNRIDAREREIDLMDVCVDDDFNASWLGAKEAIVVYSIPHDQSMFEDKYGHLVK